MSLTLDIAALSDEELADLQLRIAVEAASRLRASAPARAAAVAAEREAAAVTPSQAAKVLGVHRSTPHTWGVTLDEDGCAPLRVWRAAQAAAGGRGRKRRAR